MRALVCKQFGPLEDVELQALASPRPGPGQVLVDVHAAGVNFPDLLSIQGKYQVRSEPPFTPGAELSGVVAALVPRGLRVADIGTGTGALLPVLAALAIELGISPITLTVPVALAASCAFMLPVATPPNAIVFGSGMITIPQMAKAGLVMNLIGIVLLSLVALFLAPQVLG